MNKAFNEGYNFIQIKILTINLICFDYKYSKKYAGSFGSKIDPPEPATAECQLKLLTNLIINQEHVELLQ